MFFFCDFYFHLHEISFKTQPSCRIEPRNYLLGRFNLDGN